MLDAHSEQGSYNMQVKLENLRRLCNTLFMVAEALRSMYSSREEMVKKLKLMAIMSYSLMLSACMAMSL